MDTADGAGARGGAPGAGEWNAWRAIGVTAGSAFAAAGRHPPAAPAASRSALAGAGLGEELLEAAPDAIVVVDESGRIRIVNEQAETLFGYRRDELVGASVELLLPARSREAHITERPTYVARPRRRPMGQGRDLLARRKDGTEVPVDIALSPLRTAEGLLVLAAVRDVTHVTRTEERLRQAHVELEREQGRLRTIYEALACGVIVRDGSGAIVEANDVARRMFGAASLAEMRARSPVVRRLREDGSELPAAEAPYAVVLREGRPVRDFTIGALLEDGTTHWFQADAVAVLGPDGGVAQVVSSFVEITDRKRLQQDAERRRFEATALADAARLVAAGTAGGTTLQSILEGALRVVPARVAFFLLPRDGGTVLEIAAIAGSQERRLQRLAASQGVTGRAFRTGAAQVVSDVRTDPDYVEGEKGIRSELAVPIVTGGAVIGVLNLEDDGVARFGPREAHLIQGFAAHAAAALEIDHLLTETFEKSATLRLLRSAVENANDAVVITDADLERPGPRILYVNPAYTRMTGFAEEEVIGGSPRVSQGAHTDADVRLRLRQTLEQGKAFRGENVNYRKDGTAYDVELHIAPIRDAEGRTTHYVSVQRDVTDRKRAERELERLALYDTLTGLPNRSLFHDRLELAIAAARREGSSLALLLIDLDGFKDVNDTFGHPAGDELLRQVGPRLRAELREVDTVARLGGDEFALLLPGATAASAAKLASKLVTALDQPFSAAGQVVAIGGSIGVAVYPEHGDDAELLLRCADVAMYAAKGSGSACAFYAPDLDIHSPSRLALVAALRQAIGDGGLVLHYQPVLNIATGQVTAVEALVRWPRADRLMPPAEFIPIAERTGLIRPLTEWVLASALRQQAAWRAAGLDLSVAVNVSMRNLVDPAFPDTVERLLGTGAWTSAPLRFEITESVIMADAERTEAILARLRRMGVRTDIDDFGTGYSSLAYLQRLPVDAVKIDRSFVGRMTSDEGSAAIVRSTIELCHALGLAVVAEGVEDRQTWEGLAALGCDAAQGYYLSAPLPAPELERWLTERAVHGGGTTAFAGPGDVRRRLRAPRGRDPCA